ncbi:hypothetical protein [Chromobacterium sphagni]|uniref:MABP domain-containing protein n=1 Tax=Chromobacterium sphagni TaxID=1903179 RepID=A0A1S1WSZ7_9NEIS|nr:hypothetical protein [Chromobacterium sphagni]OHX10215.1 hypothetical protein BI347_20630 [Chromobacterium sphagni]OHX18908.1 hypothetical protein BI344_19730 [Chromobacterium sphagni]
MPYVVNITAAAIDNDDWRSKLPPGEGWTVVTNKNGSAQDFNQGAKGKFIYIYYQTAQTGKGVSAIRFITGKDATPPAGWQKVNVDLNDGAGGLFIYLCFQNSAETNYIGRIQSGYGDTVQSAFGDFDEYAVVMAQDINQGAGGKFIYLGYNFNG